MGKRLSAAILMLAMILSFSSCGEKPSEDTSSAASVATGDASSEDEYLDPESSSPENNSEATGDASNAASNPGKTSSNSNQTSSKNSGNSSSTVKLPNVPVYKYNGAGVGADGFDYSKVTVPEYNKDGNKKVKIAIMWDKNSSWVKSWTEAYEKVYKGTVEYTVIKADSNYFSDLAKMKAAGKALDGAIGQMGSWPGAIRKDLVQEAGKYIDFSVPFWQTVGNIQKSVQYNKKDYLAIGEFKFGGGVVYNKQLLKKVGLPEPAELYMQGKWNWDMFLFYAQQLTIDSKGQGTNDVWGVDTQWWEQFMLSCGSDIVSVSGNGYKVNIGEKNYARLMAFLAKLGPTQLNVAPKVSWTEEQKMMREQKLGMLITYNPGEYFPDMMDAGTLGFAPIPKDPGADTYYHPFDVAGVYILNGASNPKAAAEYAAAVRIASDENLTEKFAPSAAQDTNKSATYKATAKEIRKLLNHAAANLTPVLPVGTYMTSDDFHYWDLWYPVMYESASWASTVKKFTPVINAEIKKQS